MALINKVTVLQYTLRLLEKTPLAQGVALYSYKRNRKVSLIKTAEDHYRIKVDGYINSDMEIEKMALEKELRAIIKQEFPRSRKIRLYKISDLDNNSPGYQKI